MAIALGIDTGGTYTDAVLVEYQSNRVLASAKALTTKRDLAVGIRQAMDKVLAAHPSEVQLVSLSTTLATNAIVEGNGAPIAVLLLGYRGRYDPNARLESVLDTDRYALIAGGHTSEGAEWEPLDLEAARAAILEHAAEVSAFAISGFFGTRNPSHEMAVKALVQDLAGLPVTCGHELTHRLDALKRATTVALNARLIPLLCHLMDAVETTMAERGIEAPLMVVKGDGSLMESRIARDRPIETILSGPAASVVGAQHLACSHDSIVVDMGGTTTDIAVIREGRPRLDPRGAQVGGWRTMVEAIDVHTVGLGGDSQVGLDREGDLTIGPRRVMPLCLLAAEHPQVLDTLEAQATAGETKTVRGAGEFLVLQSDTIPQDGDHPPFERALLDALRRGPCAIPRVHELMRHPSLYARYLARLERQQIVVRAGLTPTDAAHVLGEYAEWDARAAWLGARIMVGREAAEGIVEDVETLCRRIRAHASERIAIEIVSKLLDDDAARGDGTQDIVSSTLLMRALHPIREATLGVSLSLRPALVAVGAPVHTYFDQVSRHLNGNLCIPKHTEVANAVGAVAGSVVHRVHILVVPHPDHDVYRVHAPDGLTFYRDLADAVAYARQHGEELAVAAAREQGAADIHVQVEQRDHTAPVALGYGDQLYLSTDVDIAAVGRPLLIEPPPPSEDPYA